MFGKKKLIREYNDLLASMLTAYEDLSYDFVRPDASGLDFSYGRLGERTQQLLSIKKFFEDISPNNASSYVSSRITEIAHDLKKAAMNYINLQAEKLKSLQKENAELQAKISELEKQKSSVKQKDLPSEDSERRQRAVGLRFISLGNNDYFASNKIPVIKCIREYTGRGLKEAKETSEGAQAYRMMYTVEDKSTQRFYNDMKALGAEVDYIYF